MNSEDLTLVPSNSYLYLLSVFDSKNKSVASNDVIKNSSIFRIFSKNIQVSECLKMNQETKDFEKKSINDIITENLKSIILSVYKKSYNKKYPI